jgi:hypothetical protein
LVSDISGELAVISIEVGTVLESDGASALATLMLHDINMANVENIVIIFLWSEDVLI